MLWPTKIKPDPNGVARLGRVLHWGIALLGVIIISGGLWSGFQYQDYWDRMNTFAYAGFGVFVFMCGRAVRYVLAGE